MKRLIQLSITDFKLIFRDPSLRIFLFLPMLIFAVILLLLPILLENYNAVERFVPVVLMGATVQTSTMFGFIYGMVLIHEKDIQVAKVYGVLPVAKTGYVALRMILPFVFSWLMTFCLLMVQPFYAFHILDVVLLAMLCGLLGPLLALTVTILSKNKMEGMTWFKLVNLVVTLPLIAFFTAKYASLFSVIPTYWPFQALNDMAQGESPMMHIGIGFVLTIILLGLFIRRFARTHFV